MPRLNERVPVTLENRKYSPTHSVFGAAAFSSLIDVIFVHNTPQEGGMTIFFDEQAKLLSVDMNPAKYAEFWTLLWSQRKPVLLVQEDRENTEVPTIFKTIETCSLSISSKETNK